VRARIGLTAALVLGAALGLLSCTVEKPAPRVAQFATLPDWRGIWISEGQAPGISGFPASTDTPAILRLAGFAAPWNDVGRARFGAMLGAQGNRKSKGWGYPMMMNSSAPMQFLITPEETLLLNMYGEVRHIYTDGRDHPKPEDRWPTTWGDSVGRWEGDTLIVDTVSVSEPLKFFFFAPPLSEQAHYVERFRKAGTDRIEMEMTIEDPETLAAPWTVKFVYVLEPALDRLIHDDFGNDRNELQDEVFSILPARD
jgi:hypothetical protein